MDGPIDFLHKKEASVEPDRTGECEESQGHDGGVTKIKEDGHKFGDGELGEEVKDDIKIHVESRCPRSQESSPMPVVIFAAKLEIAHDDCDFGTS